ncbi:MAG: dTMP kinase [Candidatus Nanohaloarchaeota archaeon QJJ-5]|nr:dTMP kinase [Candidatus Nanohaloarchaeota archaeon QJJ-5]
MTDTGNLYVFEGMDGVGKSTVAERFAETIDADLMQTPGDGISQIREYVDSDQHSRETKFLLYLGSNAAVSDQIEDRLEQGDDVVLDRYVPTTVAYNAAATEDDDLEMWVDRADEYDFTDPDELFYLHTDEETRKERMYGRDDVGKRHETDDEFMQEVRVVYDELIDVYDMQPIEAVDGVDNVIDSILEQTEGMEAERQTGDSVESDSPHD